MSHMSQVCILHILTGVESEPMGNPHTPDTEMFLNPNPQNKFHHATPQLAHDVMITWLLRWNDVMASFRNNDIITSCICWDADCHCRCLSWWAWSTCRGRIPHVRLCVDQGLHHLCESCHEFPSIHGCFYVHHPTSCANWVWLLVSWVVRTVHSGWASCTKYVEQQYHQQHYSELYAVQINTKLIRYIAKALGSYVLCLHELDIHDIHTVCDNFKSFLNACTLWYIIVKLSTISLLNIHRADTEDKHTLLHWVDRSWQRCVPFRFWKYIEYTKKTSAFWCIGYIDRNKAVYNFAIEYTKEQVHLTVLYSWDFKSIFWAWALCVRCTWIELLTLW